MSIQRDENLVQAFIGEASGYLPDVRAALEGCQRRDYPAESLRGIHQLMHNLKGASAMVGLDSVQVLSTVIEEFIEERSELQTPPTPEQARVLLEGIEALEAWIKDPAAWDPRLAGVSERIKASLSGKQRSAGPGEDAAQPAETENEPRASATSEEFAELREIFALEAEEHLQTIGALLPRWSESPEERPLLQEIRRSAHTVKGSAGMVGLKDVQNIAHRMEDLLDGLYEKTCDFSQEAVDVLYSIFDQLEACAEGKAQSLSPALERRVDAILEGRIVNASESTSSQEVRSTGEENEEAATESLPAAPKQNPPIATNDTSKGAYVRVRGDRLADLVNLVTELAVNRTAFERRMQLLSREIEELAPSVRQLRGVASRLDTEFELATLGSGSQSPSETEGFDELEMDQYTEFHSLSRSIQERTDDISAVHTSLNQLLSDFDQTLNRQRRVSSDIHDGLTRLQMVPFETIAARLERTTRQTAQIVDRQVAFRLHGGLIEVDKTVLDGLIDPLMHALRNAVDHGLETPLERQSVGKPERGLVQVTASHEGTQVVIRVRDDGQGINPDRIRQLAVEKGLIEASTAAELSDAQAINLVFVPGFSTAGEISEISGRGVGMDVVQSQTEKLGGSVRLESTIGSGSTLSFRIPMSLAMMRALAVQADGSTYMLPLAAVERVVRMDVADARAAVKEGYVFDRQAIEASWLNTALGGNQPTFDDQALVSILVIRSPEGHTALVVESVESAQEIAIKDFGSHTRGIPGFLGGTITGEGNVVLILDPDSFGQGSAMSALSATAILDNAQQLRTTVLLVDDSLSIRRVVGSQLSAAGFDVGSAVNGQDALEVLETLDRVPDLIILDIEMPRMDGFELMGLLRSSDRYREIPVIFQTSRSGKRHRDRASQLGASAYLTKPYDGRTLLSSIDEILGGR
ncbi:MAG: Hpt domain-containing protein [Myxococcota bacterium]